MLRYAGVLAAVAAAATLLVLTGSTGASTPPSGSVTVPSAAGQTATDSWAGTIPTGSNPRSDCNGLPSAVVDEHDIQVTVPSGTYGSLNAQFTFSITWTPQTPTEDTADEILTVIGPDGNEVGSSDGGSTTETVAAMNLAGGTYRVLACGFVNALPQQYSGKLEVTTTALEPSLPSAPAQGLQFSASVPADIQRDEAEPMITTDKAGNEYTCGPTGFSQAADYAQVSTDGGNQFHLLGTPPRGQQAAAGGGDCGWATAESTNANGNYQYAYAGLGALSGFATATSPDYGHRIGTLGADLEGGATNQGGGSDRQWLAFLDDHTVLMSYNQTAPHNTVVIKSTDSGLTYDVAHAAIGSPGTRFPGPMRYDPVNNVVFYGWDRTATGGDSINLSISKDGGATWTDCRAAVAPANSNGFVTVDSDNAGNIYLVYGEMASFHSYLVTLAAGNVSKCDNPVVGGGANPTNNPGFSQPIQVDRDAVRSTVFPWVTAGGAPGRVAVTFAGSTSDGNPNSGLFKGAWDVYVNQSLNALSTDPLNPPTFSQVKATTHPFHYDSICLNGLGCDLAVPPGDRTMADFFSIDYNPATKKLGVVFNRTNKVPNESLGHIASPTVVTQTAGPTNDGGTLGTTPAAPVVRTDSSDPTGDALSNYSLVTPGTPPPVGPPTTNESAADLTSVSAGPELDLLDNSQVTNGGFTVTMKVADLSTTALTTTATNTGSASLLWLFHFTNGYQDAAASARWAPGLGFSFGFNDYTLGSAPCETTGPVTNEKCVIFPGDTPIQGDVNQSTGTIRLSVPRFLLRALGPNDDNGRPTEVAAAAGSRFYDAAAFSQGNTVSPVQDVQSFLYPLDNTPAMDFLLGSGTGGGGFAGCKVSGGGTLDSTGGKFTVNVHATIPPTGNVVYRDANTNFRSTAIASVSCAGSKATIRGSGTNGNDNVTFRLDVTDNGESGTTDVFSLMLTPGGERSGTLKRGNIQVQG